MAEVIAAGQAEATSAADESSQGERAGDEEPEDGGVEEGVDREARPDGVVRQNRPSVGAHLTIWVPPRPECSFEHCEIVKFLSHRQRWPTPSLVDIDPFVGGFVPLADSDPLIG